MRKLLTTLLATLTLPTSINAGISDELHKKCLEARDYAGCVNTNQKSPLQKNRKFQGLELDFSSIVILLN